MFSGTVGIGIRKERVPQPKILHSSAPPAETRTSSLRIQAVRPESMSRRQPSRRTSSTNLCATRTTTTALARASAEAPSSTGLSKSEYILVVWAALRVFTSAYRIYSLPLHYTNYEFGPGVYRDAAGRRGGGRGHNSVVQAVRRQLQIDVFRLLLQEHAVVTCQ